MWWLGPAEYIGEIILGVALRQLEKKYPGIKPVFDEIIRWLEGKGASSTNRMPVMQLGEHIEKLKLEGN